MKILAVLGLVLTTTYSYKILLYHGLGTRSHLQLFFPLAEELLSRGHEVTGVYYASAKIRHENYTEIVTADPVAFASKRLSEIYMEADQNSNLGSADPRTLWKTFELWPTVMETLASTLKSPALQAVLKQKFDVVVSQSIIVGYIADTLDCNIIYMTPFGPAPTIANLIGNQFFPSQSPAATSFFDQPEKFGQRLTNFWITKFHDIWFYSTSYGFYSTLAPQLGYTGPDFMETLRDRLQVLLTNSNPITHDPQPFLENVVHVGGMHIKPNKPLPADLQDFLDNSPEGVILVSFGSSITPSSMGEEKRKAFIEAFRQLKQRIIWKWDEDASHDTPDNVLISKWLPQNDILAHPNLKVFVTHGGLLSTMEAIYHGTLLVGTPIANDQKPNLKRVENNNIGKMLKWGELSTEVLVDAINTVLNDKKMAASMKKLSAQFKDTKERPVEKAAWWVEFVIRNNGTDFLKPKSMHLSMYQAWNLDILAAGVLSLVIVLYINYKILKLCCSCCCSRFRKVKSD